MLSIRPSPTGPFAPVAHGPFPGRPLASPPAPWPVGRDIDTARRPDVATRQAFLPAPLPGRRTPVPTSFEELLAALDADARVDTVRTALFKYADGLRNLGLPDTAALVDRKATDLGYDTSLPGDYNEVAEALLRPEIERGDIDRAHFRQALSAFFTRDRGAGRQSEAYRVVPVDPPPLPPAPLQARPVRYGFDPAVLATDPKSPHSMTHPERYVSLRLPQFLVRDLVENHRVVEIHTGTANEALCSLQQRGFDRFARIHAPRCSTLSQIYLARRPTGEARYVITEFVGEDWVGHLQRMLRFSTHDGRPVSADQVEVHADPARDGREELERYRRVVHGAGIAPTNVVIGFKNSLLRLLRTRQRAADAIRFLRGALGDDPAKELPDRLRAETGADGSPCPALCDLAAEVDSTPRYREALSSAPREMLAHHERCEALCDLEQRLGQAAALVPDSPTLAQLVPEGAFPATARALARATGDGWSDQALLSFLDTQGHRQVLLLVRTPYGDSAARLGQALADEGAERITLIGTAGGIGPGIREGEIVVPTSFVTARDEVVSQANNALAEFLRSRDRAAPLRVGSRLREITCPLQETMALVGELRSRGYDIIEMEACPLFDAASRHPAHPQLASAQIVSDLPGQGRTLDMYCTAGPVQESLESLADVLVDFLDIASLEEPPADPLGSLPGSA